MGLSPVCVLNLTKREHSFQNTELRLIHTQNV